MWLGVLVAFGALSRVGGVGDDARLSKPISMRVKIEALSAFTSDLQKASGVKFVVADDIADRKITAIFHDRPVSEVMWAVSDALFMQWKRVGDGYRLVLPADVDREEREMAEAEDDAIKAGLLEGLKNYAKTADLSTDEIAKQDKAIRAEVANLQSDSSPDGQERLESLREQRAALHSTAAMAISKDLSSDLPGMVDGLLAGKTYFASPQQMGSVLPLPAGFMDRITARFPDATSCLLMLRYNPSDQSLQGASCLPGGELRGNMMTDFSFYRPLAHVALGGDSGKLLARLKKWQADADAGVMDKAVSADGRKEDAPNYFSRAPGFTLAEHLEYLADHADVPVIGDAFRLYCSPASYFGPGSVRAYVTALMGSKHMGRSVAHGPLGYFAARKGWLFVRHDRYWHKQTLEMSEAQLAPLETAAMKSDYATVDDYARFCVGLTPGQVLQLQYGHLDLALRFDPFPFQKALGSIRLWGVLSPEQRGIAAGAGLDLTQLNAAQAQTVVDGWAAKMWTGEIRASLWASVLSPKLMMQAKPVLKVTTFDSRNIPRRADANNPPPGFVVQGSRPAGSPPSGIRMPEGGQLQVDFSYVLQGEFQIHDLYLVAMTHAP